jgi:hypothetical protein
MHRSAEFATEEVVAIENLLRKIDSAFGEFTSPSSIEEPARKPSTGRDVLLESCEISR